MKTGIERIAAERQRQVEVEGWTPEHDDEHDGGQMSAAATAYAFQGHLATAVRFFARDPIGFWPWDVSWWKPSDDPIRNLEKAGALIAAEIDRLQRIRGQS